MLLTIEQQHGASVPLKIATITLAGVVTLCIALSARAAPEADLWSIWDRQGSEVGIDHSLWQSVLGAHVVAGADGINLVDYDALRGDRSSLDQYIAYLASIDPRSYTRDEQMAYWVNFYNALTIQLVLAYPNKKSILRMGERLFSIGPWDDVVTTVAGEPVTLNDIEHRILRPIWQDHRIHYAVNCASLGCPNLSQEAYQPSTLVRQLAAAEKAYLAHPRGVSIKKRTVTLSTIFKWYRSDFGVTEADVLEYVAQHHAALAQLRKDNERLKVRYDYDWALNAADSD